MKKSRVRFRQRRYRFEEVRRALEEQWGLKLKRPEKDDERDGRWDVSYSRTGYVASGQFPGNGYRYRRFRSLAEVVRRCKLDLPLEAKAQTVTETSEETPKPSFSKTYCDSCDAEVVDEYQHWSKTKERPDGFYTCHPDIGKCRCAKCNHVWKPQKIEIPEKCPACGERDDLFWADDGGWPALNEKNSRHHHRIDW